MRTNADPLAPGATVPPPDLVSLCASAAEVDAGIEAAAAALARRTPFVHRQLRAALHTAIARGVALTEASEILERFGPFHLVDATRRLSTDEPGLLDAR